MAEFSDKPGYAFNPGPPPEASAYFRNKGIRPSFSWEDVEPSEHATSFAVAKAMNIDVLETIQGALQQGLDEGIPYEQFARELKPRLQRLGWWGVKERLDPLGEARKVQLGSPRRLRTIYRANIRTARAVGQWDRIQRTKRALPYLVYLLGPSERHRPHHASKEGLVLPVDDPFWASWYPPNGWNCKCHVRQVTRREAEERGISDAPNVPMRDVFNKRTGEIKRIPSGIDVGWEKNPGLLRQRNMERFLAGKLNAADPTIARAAARDLASSWRVKRIAEGTAKGGVPIAMLPKELAEKLGSKSKVTLFSDATAAKQKDNHPELVPDDYLRLIDLLENGRVVTQGKNHIGFVGRDLDLPWIAVIKVTRDLSELYLQTLFRPGTNRYVNRFLKRGEVLRE